MDKTKIARVLNYTMPWLFMAFAFRECCQPWNPGVTRQEIRGCMAVFAAEGDTHTVNVMARDTVKMWDQ